MSTMNIDIRETLTAWPFSYHAGLMLQVPDARGPQAHGSGSWKNSAFDRQEVPLVIFNQRCRWRPAPYTRA